MAQKKDKQTKDTTTKARPGTKKAPKVAIAAQLREEKKFPVVGIGASAGGLEAFEAFFRAMPPDSGMAFILVAHLDPTHVSILPELVQKQTKMRVFQAKDGMVVQPNSVYVIPPNKDLSILNRSLQLMESLRPRGAPLPIDSFFRSLARDQGANSVGIVLSGTGTDGTLGLKAIKGETGMIMVQDEQSAKYDGMPKSAIATKLVDYILPPDKMPEQLVGYTRYAARKGVPEMLTDEGNMANILQKIYLLLRNQTDHDFSLYKKNTIIRRIERRMNVLQIDEISDYVRYLRESEREVTILFKELLIGVTNFFRDPAAFDKLKNAVLPEMLKGKPDDYPLRVWAPGCSTGEETYSIAIILHECMADLDRHFNVQIFGTDIDEDAVNTARIGLYPASISADVGPERLKRYFIQENGHYRIKKSVREMLVFATQNVIKDPPFTKLDLLSCRNLLIYLGQELQRKILPVFHYSLKPDGILFLGSSETIGQFTDLFTLLDKKWRIFKRKPTASAIQPLYHYPAYIEPYREANIEMPEFIKKAEELSAFQLAETILQQSDTPPCAIIDDSCNIVYIHGRTGKFLEPAIGKLSVNIVEMARRGLKTELASAIRSVAANKQQVVCRGLTVQNNGSRLFADVIVKPILEGSALRGMMLVMFEETAGLVKKEKEKARRPAKKSKIKDAEQLEQELLYTKENLQTTIEELETSNEELKSANEELQSTNEELQSTNEELETSKEELQSLNEESATVNVELQSRIDELSKTNDDMKNLLDSTQIATIFLDFDLCVRRFTPKAAEVVNLMVTDSGRPIRHLTSNLVHVDLEKDATQVLKTLVVQEKEVQSKDGRFFFLRILPYRTINNVIDGVVITFENISHRKVIENEMGRAKLLAEGIVETVREPLLVLDGSLQIISANRSFYTKFSAVKKETIGKSLYKLGNLQWDVPDLRRLLDDILPSNSEIEGYQVEHDFPKIGHRKMLLNARRLFIKESEEEMILLAVEDITDKESVTP